MPSTQHILVIGGNGGIGRQCIEQGLSAGYRVTAILRTPSKLTRSHATLDIVQGDVIDPASILPYLNQKDAIISAVGIGGKGNDWPDNLYSQSATTVLSQMRKTSTRRVFFISSAAIEVNPTNSLINRFIGRVINRLFKRIFNDIRQMEAVIKTSDLDWTIIRPSRLTTEPSTGKYRYALNDFLPNSTQIARGDVAHFIINHINDPATFRATVELTY